jgi:hypothetical protein
MSSSCSALVLKLYGIPKRLTLLPSLILTPKENYPYEYYEYDFLTSSYQKKKEGHSFRYKFISPLPECKEKKISKYCGDDGFFFLAPHELVFHNFLLKELTFIKFKGIIKKIITLKRGNYLLLTEPEKLVSLSFNKGKPKMIDIKLENKIEIVSSESRIFGFGDLTELPEYLLFYIYGDIMLCKLNSNGKYNEIFKNEDYNPWNVFKLSDYSFLTQDVDKVIIYTISGNKVTEKNYIMNQPSYLDHDSITHFMKFGVLSGTHAFGTAELRGPEDNKIGTWNKYERKGRRDGGQIRIYPEMRDQKELLPLQLIEDIGEPVALHPDYFIAKGLEKGRSSPSAAGEDNVQLWTSAVIPKELGFFGYQSIQTINTSLNNIRIKVLPVSSDIKKKAVTLLLPLIPLTKVLITELVNFL